ncbi:hypothetical protein D3C76_1269810 [compost metagenome]
MQGQQASHHLADPRDHDIAGRQVDRDVQLRVGPQQLPQLLKQALQDKVGHLADLPGVLCHRDKQVGTGQGAVRPSPAQQGFGPDAVAAVEVKDRLIEHLQLTSADGSRQLCVK